jgi:hypothetical protein
MASMAVSVVPWAVMKMTGRFGSFRVRGTNGPEDLQTRAIRELHVEYHDIRVLLPEHGLTLAAGPGRHDPCITTLEDAPEGVEDTGLVVNH